MRDRNVSQALRWATRGERPQSLKRGSYGRTHKEPKGSFSIGGARWFVARRKLYHTQNQVVKGKNKDLDEKIYKSRN